MGIITNADSSLTPAMRAQRESDERNDARIQDAVDRSKKMGPVPREIGESGALLATYDQLADTKAYAKGDRSHIKPIGYRTGPEFAGGFQWALTDADADLIRQGLACQRCLDFYPATWTPACTTCLLDRG